MTPEQKAQTKISQFLGEYGTPLSIFLMIVTAIVARLEFDPWLKTLAVIFLVNIIMLICKIEGLENGIMLGIEGSVNFYRDLDAKKKKAKKKV